uniref:histidine kinase n=1 Tax=Solibacter usitatus (strain Ellin6076) TaxID=234267 RepID=Q01ZL6_SOLUE
MNKRLWAGIVALLAAVAVFTWYCMRPPDFGNRVYRIGWMISPPFQLRGPDGGPSGISVELVKQAARRVGIKLEWRYWNSTSDSALLSNSVDLWPLITIRPERLKVLHITDPYLQHEHCLLVRDDSSFTRAEDLATANIGMANVNIDARLLHTILPHAVPVPSDLIGGAIDDVCNRAADAAFMDRFTATAALLQRGGCGGHALRWIPVPQLHVQLGVGSTFEHKDAADAIRREIGALAQEGKLASIFGQWGYMSGQDAAIMGVIDSRRREARLFTIALVFALMFLLAVWQTVRLTREKTRTLEAEKALRESQERYMQSQKMESIGRLAGGVAHDFNNILTVINGYSDIVYHQLSEVDPRRAQVNEIRKAGAHAAELTQQLLAFSRKQVGRPRPVNLNSVVSEAEKMLRRILGEDVRLITRLDPSTGLILADPGYVHQMLMNLAVNARDAMPDGGSLVIETSDAQRHDEEGSRIAVCLSVTDTGSGMDEETRKNIFEPFFTTKGTKGTGLGLATVYGIVQQSQGSIEVLTEPGKGSTFRVYLPRVEGVDESPVPKPAAAVAVHGAETILVVEDQDEVRCFVVDVLARRGYRVLQAGDGPQALAVAEQCTGKIDVLLTDVVLPGMNGRELAERFRELRPATKIIYTSGYTQDLIADRGILHRDVNYVPKPYTADQITAKVREAIDAP